MVTKWMGDRLYALASVQSPSSSSCKWLPASLGSGKVKQRWRGDGRRPQYAGPYRKEVSDASLSYDYIGYGNPLLLHSSSFLGSGKILIQSGFRSLQSAVVTKMVPIVFHGTLQGLATPVSECVRSALYELYSLSAKQILKSLSNVKI